MRYPLIYTSILTTLLFAACNKEKFTTEPQVKAKSVSPETVTKGQTITFTSSFTDDEGDVQDSVLVVIKRYNGAANISLDTLRLKLDSKIPKARQGDIIVKFTYGELQPYIYIPLETIADREATFGIIIRDKAGNRSNYSESDRFTLKKL